MSVLTTIAPRLLNVGLRGLALVSRFALLFFLAKLLEPEEVGLFGLFLAIIAFSIFLIGGDFYAFSHREMLSRPREQWFYIMQHHISAIVILYLIFLPFQILIFSFDFLPLDFLIWFYPLLIVEHITLEMNRFLVVMKKPLLASWVLFLRMGAWVWVLVPIIWFNPDARSLDTVFFYWLLGGTAALFLGAAGIIQEVPFKGFCPLSREWIIKGFRVGGLFLIATLLLRTLFTVDRFIVDALLGSELLAVYVLYAGIAMAVYNFLDPAIFSFLYPKLVSAYRRGDICHYRKLYKELWMSTLAVSILLAISAATVAPWLLEWVGRNVYLEHISLLWLLLFVVVVYALSMVPHYGLYSVGGDRTILVAHLLAVILFTCSIWILSEHKVLESVAWSLLLAFLGLGVFKLLGYLRLAPRDDKLIKRVSDI